MDETGKNIFPGGASCGIGSLPFTDTPRALSLVRRYLPEIPHWPQLPRRTHEEGFVYQFLNPLVEMGLITISGEKTYFDTSSEKWPGRMTEFYESYLLAEDGDLKALDKFAFSPRAAAGFFAFLDDIDKNRTGSEIYLKGQLAGPLTIGLQLKDDKGRYIYYDKQLRDILIKTLTMHGKWQARELGKLGLPVVIFVDEPGIRAYGQFSYITISREMILEDMRTLLRGLHDSSALTGVHSCDAIDWTILFEMPELDIVSFDAYGYFNSLLPYMNSLKKFLEGGGILAWGIVPTSEKVMDETRESLLKKLFNQWDELSGRGISKDLVLAQSLVTPSCGAGLLKYDEAERIYMLTAEVSGMLRKPLSPAE